MTNAPAETLLRCTGSIGAVIPRHYSECDNIELSNNTYAAKYDSSSTMRPILPQSICRNVADLPGFYSISDQMTVGLS